MSKRTALLLIVTVLAGILGFTASRAILSPGLDLRTSRFATQLWSSSTFSPMSFARERAAMRPPNMALEASAISSASPAVTAR